MKTTGTLSLLFVLIMFSVQGQKNKSGRNSSGEKCYDENTHIINLGVGFGGAGYYKGGKGGTHIYRNTPAFSLSYEQALKNKLGPGYLGVGAYFGYQASYYRYEDVYYNGNYYYYQHRWNHILVAARGAYHLDFLNAKNAEVYAGVIVGVRLQTYSYETNNPDPVFAELYRLNEGVIYPSYSLFVGARWYFVPNVAVFGEAGYGISSLTGGVSFKF
jgi:hypothetical protein